MLAAGQAGTTLGALVPKLRAGPSRRARRRRSSRGALRGWVEVRSFLKGDSVGKKNKITKRNVSVTNRDLEMRGS